MKNFIKIYIFIFILFSNYMMFATDPGDDTGGEDLEDTNDPQPAPINKKIIILLIFGLVYAFYTFRKKYKKI